MRQETDEVNKAMSTKMKLVLFDLNSHFIRIFSIGYLIVFHDFFFFFFDKCIGLSSGLINRAWLT